MAINCDYYPACQRKFSHAARKAAHTTKEHQRPGRLFCRECTEGKIRFFATTNSLRTHQRNHEPVPCGTGECTALVTRSNLARHRARCTARLGLVVSVSAASDSNSDEAPDPDEQAPFGAETIYRPPRDDTSTRAPRAAPDLQLVSTSTLESFLEWYKNPMSLGRALRGKHSKDHTTKFLTMLGKMKTCFGLSDEEVRNKLNGRENVVTKFLSSEGLNALMQHIGRRKGGGVLKATTRYNQLRPLVNLLKFYVTIKKFDLASEYKAVLETSIAVSKERAGEIEIEKKAERIAGLPDVDDFVQWLYGDLKDAFKLQMDRFAELHKCDAEMYIAARNFVLVLLLFATPPQRLQLLVKMEISNVEVDSNGMYTCAIPEHKTKHLYGTAIMYIPKHLTSDFDNFRMLREELLKEQCVRTSDASFLTEDCVFVGTDGRPDKYLTSRFEKLVWAKFSKHVTVRDCRSIYITYANKHATSTKEMYELSRFMYHSFITQQQIYRADTSQKRLALAQELGNRIASLHMSSDSHMLPFLQDIPGTSYTHDSEELFQDELASSLLEDELHIRLLQEYEEKHPTEGPM